MGTQGQQLGYRQLADLEPNKRYAVTLAFLISQRLARVTNDLCNLF